MGAVHSKIGASSAYRWQACPGSVKLCEPLPNISSVYAEEGTKAHDVAAQWLTSGVCPDGVDAEMLEAVEVYVNLIEAERPEGCEALVEHGFDLSSVHPGLFGTCDAIIFDSKAKTLRVYDYKHGAGIPVEVERNSQLVYYALGALLSTGFPADLVELVIVQPRAVHAGGPIRRWTLPTLELIDFAADLKDSAVRTEASDAPLNAGDWCHFCPAKAICPALEARARAVAKSEFDPVVDKANYDPKRLGEILSQLDHLETWASGVRGFAYAEAEAGRPIPGWKLVAKRATRKWISPEEASEFFRTEFPNVTDVFEEPALKSPAQVEKILHSRQHDKLTPLIVSRSSGSTLVPDSDPRPELKVLDAKSEFELLDLLS